MWFNNVESKPGIGYPRQWENQEVHRGGWRLKNGKLELKAGGRAHKMLNIFHNPDLPVIDEYYEPWSYDYEKLIQSPPRRNQPSIRPVSQITGEAMRIKWGPNWEDDLAGVSETGAGDVNFSNLDYRIYLKFRNVFMFYLPRLCEHCLNPACVASCPSGALYKREEDGIVLVDQERCRGWRFCVSGCPYKKVYFNWKTGRSEKCLFCYPRIEAGMTTLCAHTCVGRIRYVGIILYDADRISAAASVAPDYGIYPAHLEMFLDPMDPKIRNEAAAQGSPRILSRRPSILHLACQSLETGPASASEYRTLPMVWYIPPISPVLSDAQNMEERDVVDTLRIPITYLANLFTAGDEAPVRLALKRLMAIRQYMRSIQVENQVDENALERVGLTVEMAKEMYHLLALARLNVRFVVPTVGRTEMEGPFQNQGSCGYPDQR
jgi:nitrate reductase beta subunit